MSSIAYPSGIPNRNNELASIKINKHESTT
jgi:hypothetical protein